MTNSRIKAAQKEIQQILMAKPEYLVNTSEFNDVKGRLTRIQEHRRLETDKDWSRPRLRQRPGMSSGRVDENDDGGKPGQDERPTLKRRTDQ